MFVSAAWIGPAILGGINEVAQRRLGDGSPAPIGAVLFGIGDWLIYAFLTPAVFALSRRWPLARPHLASHAFFHLTISLFFCVAWAAVGAVLRAMLMPEALYGGPFMYFVSWLFITLPFGVSVYLAVVGIEHGIRFFVEAREQEIQNARLSAQLSSARFAALSAQLNPHFLFNTLNTVAVLVRDGERTAAARIVEQLSDVLRRTLSRHCANEVTLDEELELVEQYLAIEQARFPDRLRVTFEVDPLVRPAVLPGFALQHLVENAVRHGIAGSPDAGHVSVAARRDGHTLEISVLDDGVGADREAPFPAGHGIENTRSRLRALYSDRASLEVARRTPRGTIATLRIPYREMPESEDGADLED